MAFTSNDLKSVRQRRYIAKDFDGFRSLLLEYARLYFSDKINDFSESSVGGLFLDFAAYTGDTLSYYLDHQFGELNVESAVEPKNIERMLRSAGVPIVGSSPAIAYVTWYFKVPASFDGVSYVPSETALPIVKAGSIVSSDNVEFQLLHDIDFSTRNDSNKLVVEYVIGDVDRNNYPKTFIVAASGWCTSGKLTTDTIQIGSTFVPFRQVSLTNTDVNEIVSVTDDYGNTYYEVGALTEDVVYRNVANTSSDNTLVTDALKVIPAPFRYLKQVDVSTRSTKLVLGGGNALSTEDDIIPDPSEFAVPMVYTRTFPRMALNPDRLLQTKTLGVYAVNTTLNVTYRYGGGLDHNVPANTIKEVVELTLEFPQNPMGQIIAAVRGSVEVNNNKPASGGEDPPTIDDLRALIPAMRNTQERIVTKEDVIARVYTLPSNFGRVFRCAIHPNSNNPSSSLLYVISRDSESRLTVSPDTLKKNLVTYLNTYRMISDAIDILDAAVINIAVTFEIVVDPTLNKSVVLQSVMKKLSQFFDIKNFNIDQPIVLDDVRNAIYTTDGVMSLTNDSSLNIKCMSGVINNKTYSDVSFDVTANTAKGMIIPPRGAIFELKYPDVDIVGRAV